MPHKCVQANSYQDAEDIARSWFRRDQYLEKVVAKIKGKIVIITRKDVFGEKV